MNFSLHLTDGCNLSCSYCVRDKSTASMSEEILTAACDLAFSKGNTAGLCFFGGEPLLEKALIYRALDYCEEKSRLTGKPFSCKMTTNGTLLDEKFLDRAAKAGMVIGVSFDGAAQDICRRFENGSGTYDILAEKSRLLLKKMPLSYAMMTIAPQAADKYLESVKSLRDTGFKRVTATIAYGKNVRWTDEAVETLREQLRLTAEYYREIFLRGEYFFLSAFDAKIRDCISGFNPSERCHLGFRQMPVAPDGKIYPCTQFIGDEDYLLGDVFSGISTEKQTELINRASLPESCKECELKNRCTNSCGCMNRLETGNENTVSPLQCTYERMLIEICDDLAQSMFEAEPERFEKRFKG